MMTRLIKVTSEWLADNHRQRSCYQIILLWKLRRTASSCVIEFLTLLTYASPRLGNLYGSQWELLRFHDLTLAADIVQYSATLHVQVYTDTFSPTKGRRDRSSAINLERGLLEIVGVEIGSGKQG